MTVDMHLMELRKQTLDQENNRKRAKPSRKDKNFQCVSFMSFVIESCDSVTTLATAQASSGCGHWDRMTRFLLRQYSGPWDGSPGWEVSAPGLLRGHLRAPTGQIQGIGEYAGSLLQGQRQSYQPLLGRQWSVCFKQRIMYKPILPKLE